MSENAVSSLPHPLTALIRSQLQEAANPDKAGPMQAYMKTDQPFYGVQANPRRKLFKAAARDHKDLSRKEYERVPVGTPETQDAHQP